MSGHAKLRRRLWEELIGRHRRGEEQEPLQRELRYSWHHGGSWNTYIRGWRGKARNGPLQARPSWLSVSWRWLLLQQIGKASSGIIWKAKYFLFKKNTWIHDLSFKIPIFFHFCVCTCVGERNLFLRYTYGKKNGTEMFDCHHLRI